MSNIYNLFGKGSYIEHIILTKHKNIFQKFAYQESPVVYEIPVICIVKLKNNEFSTICIIDNEMHIMKNNKDIILGEIIVEGIKIELERYSRNKPTSLEIIDISNTYLWISTENKDEMKFLRIEKWIVVDGGFLKSVYYNGECLEFTENIIGNKIYCLNNTYLALKDIVR